MVAQEVIEFIERRFKQDCNWKTGNCYYFALILCDRFKQYNPEIYYDAVDGHFLCKINDRFYDWGGAISFSDEYVEKWSDICKEDPTWSSCIVRDVIL